MAERQARGSRSVSLSVAQWLLLVLASAAALVAIVMLLLPVHVAVGPFAPRCGQVWDTPYSGEGLMPACHQAINDRRVVVRTSVFVACAAVGLLFALRLRRRASASEVAVSRRTLALSGVLLAAVGIGAYLELRDDRPETDRYPVTWSLSGHAPDRNSTSFGVTLSDDQRCADGIPLAQRMLPPRVSYSDRTVIVTLTAEQRPGLHTCPGPIGGNSLTIDLDQPLGDRTLVDGNAAR